MIETRSQELAGKRPGACRQAGFSLIEFGIVLAVIAVLGGVVLASRGYLIAARKKATTDLVMTIRTAARQFAMRHQSGLRFGDPLNLTGDSSVSLKGLRAEGFLPKDLRTPWGGDKIVVAAANTPAPLCTGLSCVSIQIGELPGGGNDSEKWCEDFNKFFSDKAVQVTCENATLTVIMR